MKERYEPFYDLLQLIQVKPGLKVIDLGCGTGELTYLLSEHLPGSQVLGIDSSAEMLSRSSQYSNERVSFSVGSIEELIKQGNAWDLVFSNAALQWVENHEQLIPGIISMLKPGAQIAVQVPFNQDHFTHTAIRKLALEEPFSPA